jgi:hypothetical protein
LLHPDGLRVNRNRIATKESWAKLGGHFGAGSLAPGPSRPIRLRYTPLTFMLTETGRIEAFSDGVFAVAITLLIFDVHVPNATAGSLATRLLKQWPSYVSFLISFAFIGIMWVNITGCSTTFGDRIICCSS